MKSFLTSFRSLREIRKNSVDIVSFMSRDLGERTLRRYESLEGARSFIAGYFRKSCHEPIEDRYTVQGKEVSNLIVEIPGYEEPERVILITGHYDTVEGTPGADDNATAIAAILEIHRLLSPYRFKKTLRFAIFTLEEPPFFRTPEMGSFHYAKACKARKEKIDLMIAIDMIGFACKQCLQKFPVPMKKESYPPFGDYLTAVSVPSMAPWVYLWKKIYNTHTKHRIYDMIGPASVPGVDLSDHSSFLSHGYPGIMLTDTAFYRNDNYHMPGDTFETINFDFLAENIHTIMLTLKDICNISGALVDGASDRGV